MEGKEGKERKKKKKKKKKGKEKSTSFGCLKGGSNWNISKARMS